MSNQKVLIVGGGIIGLAFAFSAAERGCDVTLCERHASAHGASIRNFGMVWPIGQPHGQLHRIAMLSRERWGRAAAAGACWLNPCGSLHAAHNDDEFQILREFAQQAPELNISCTLLDAAQTLALSPGVNPANLRGALYSQSEACVNPPMAVAGLAAWLTSKHNITINFNTPVSSLTSSAHGGTAHLTGGGTLPFDVAIVCGGADIDTIYPGLHASLGLRQCKLQMLKTVAQPKGWRLGPHIASGLTLRHYKSFSHCPTLSKLISRIATTKPHLDALGIHVMASHHDDGGVVLGDSHEYDGDVDCFDKQSIDDYIISELHNVIQLPTWAIARRWHGIYSKHPTKPWVTHQPIPNVNIVTGLGGNGMTLSHGLAEELIESFLSRAPAALTSSH
jgi:FAD dependent oxidoreductase TIGR03364